MTFWQAVLFFCFFWTAGFAAAIVACIAAWKGWM